MSRTEYVQNERELFAALRSIGLGERRPVIVVVGGAAGLTDHDAARIIPLVEGVVVALAEELGVAIVDGGTDSGVMRVIGHARTRAHANFALIGVTAAGTIAGEAALVDDPTLLEPNHTHFVIVPGSAWGDESPWIPRVAATLADGSPVAGVLFGGGAISRRDVANLTEAGFPVFPIAGSGRLADALASSDPANDPAVDALRASHLVHPVDGLKDPPSLDAALRVVLGQD